MNGSIKQVRHQFSRVDQSNEEPMWAFLSFAPTVSGKVLVWRKPKHAKITCQDEKLDVCNEV